MQTTEKRRAFLINFFFVAIWAALIYCILKFALPLLMPFVIAFVLAFLLRSPINAITRKTKLNRKLVAAVLLTLIYIVLAVLITWLGATIIAFLANLFGRLPAYYTGTVEPALNTLIDSADVFLSRLDPSIITFLESSSASIFSALSDLVKTISTTAVSFATGMATGIPGFVVNFVLTIIASYFLTVDYYTVTAFIQKQLSEQMQKRLLSIREFGTNVLFKFLRAYLLIMLLTFTELSIGFLILRVPNGFLIAAGIACMDVLPVLGSGAILWPWAAYSFIRGDVGLGVGLVILYAVITIVRQVAEPRIVGKQIGLYPLLTLACMFLGAKLFGIWGLLGLPLAITLLIHLNLAGEIKLFKS